MITIQWFGRSLFWKFSVFFATDLFRLVLVTWESVSATSSSYLTLDIIHLIHYPLQELLAVVCFLFWLTSYQACSEQLSKEILVGTCCRRESLLGIMGQLLNNTLGLQGTVEVFLNLGTLNSSAATSCWVPECVNWWTYSLSLGLFSKAMSCICPIRGWWPPRRQYFRSGRNWCGSRYSTLRFCGDSCSSSAGPVTVLSSRISTVFSFLCTCWLSADRCGAQNSPKHRLSSRKCLSYWDCHRKAQHLLKLFQNFVFLEDGISHHARVVTCFTNVVLSLTDKLRSKPGLLSCIHCTWSYQIDAAW